MQKQITITYWWECDKIKGDFPIQLQEALNESAEFRISEMMKEGFTSGELIDNIMLDIPNKKTPNDGWECKGWWEAKENFEDVKPQPITKPYTKKEARKLVRNNALTAIVKLSFDELQVGIDCLNDAVSKMICGSETALEDIDYSFVGVINNQNENSVLVSVSGSIENWLSGKNP